MHQLKKIDSPWKCNYLVIPCDLVHGSISLKVYRVACIYVKYKGNVLSENRAGSTKRVTRRYKNSVAVREVSTDNTCSSIRKCFDGFEWLFCWTTEYPQSQGPWPWVQQIFSAEYDLILTEVKLFFLVAKKTSKLSNHFALRDASNLLRQPTGCKNHRPYLNCLEASDFPFCTEFWCV